jgi:UDP-N-acetylglucosamine--N-acetylmuramyl-(pentapeptide) pyrophosphoryl-undecaprenol N-acetylglucosamine transferase
LTGGGTGGHVYPALEVGSLAREDGDEVRYFGSYRGLESTAAPNAGFDVFRVQAEPIPKLASLAGLRAVFSLLTSTRKVVEEFRRWRPDVLFATGGYSSGPSLRAAKSLGVPIVLLEQNSIPGRAIKMMGGHAHKICTVFKETCKYFPSGSIVQTGMPIRRELVERAARVEAHAAFTTLVTGGSQGARALNAAATKLVMDVAADDWIHVAGKTQYDETLKHKMSMPAGYKLVPFLESAEIAYALSNADLAIARAGCGTIAELALFGTPAIYVPLPSSFADHQTHNALEIERLGGGAVLPQAELTPQRLEREWRAWRNDEPRRAKARSALKAWAKPQAAQHVLQVVKEAAR